MGREIRNVPKNYKHPENETCPHFAGSHARTSREWQYQTGKCFKPLYDKSYAQKREEWLDGLQLWLAGKHPDQHDCEYWEWAGNPPDKEDYRPDFGDTATCFQLYETVSEGTPLSPVFETLDELENYMVNTLGYVRGTAHAFCKQGWAPSFVYTPKTGLISGIDALDKL